MSNATECENAALAGDGAGVQRLTSDGLQHDRLDDALKDIGHAIAGHAGLWPSPNLACPVRKGERRQILPRDPRFAVARIGPGILQALAVAPDGHLSTRAIRLWTVRKNQAKGGNLRQRIAGMVSRARD